MDASPKSKHPPSVDPEQWVDRHGDALYRFAMTRVSDPDLAEELVQETFVAGLGAAAGFASRSAERTWLLGILKHKIVDCYRKLSRKEESVDPGESDDWLDGYFVREGFWHKGIWKGDGPSGWRMRPGEGLEGHEFRRALENCLQGLPKRAMMAFVLREIENMNGPDICSALAITQSNYWALLHRARMQLRRCLESNWLGRRDRGDRP